MKHLKRIVGSIVLLTGSTVVQAGPVEDLFNQGQAQMQGQFESLSDDFASVFSYKSASPAGSLAGGIIPVGFDIAFETSFTALPDDSILAGAMPGDLAYVPFPKGHVQVGVAIPFIPFVPAIDVGVAYMNIPNYFSHLGGELKVNIAGGNVVLPAVAVRGVFSSTGLSDGDRDIASMTTYGAELAVSKGFGIGIKITPYAGVGYHMFNASSGLQYTDIQTGYDIPTATLAEYAGVSGNLLDDYSGGMFKWFVGANLKLLALNFGYEMDQTGGAMTHTAKVGFVF
jgi:hypothetical protein